MVKIAFLFLIQEGKLQYNRYTLKNTSSKYTSSMRSVHYIENTSSLRSVQYIENTSR